MEKCPDILLRIIETKREELKGIRSRKADFKSAARDRAPSLDFRAALSLSHLAVIAEIKKASPSAGIIAEDFDPAETARAYSSGGADAVSVLTDRYYFGGDIEYLDTVRQYLSVPVLRKDFIIDPVQIFEARAYGADSFLLIAAVLETKQLEGMICEGRELGMEPLVEAHNEYELEKTIEAGAEIVGVNNRNLHTFDVDISRCIRLKSMIPEQVVAVAESGIKTVEDTARIASAGYSAILVGETLMRSGRESCGSVIKEFQNSPRN